MQFNQIAPILLLGFSSLAICQSDSLYDPRVESNPGVVGQVLNFWSPLPQERCRNDLSVTEVSVDGSEVKIRYSVTPAPPRLCFTLSPPLVLSVPIGAFPLGNFTATATGDYLGTANPPISVAFSVIEKPVVAVEYYRLGANHYFITASPDEIAKLDSGFFVGWVRTGETINVFPPSPTAPIGLTPVCRFYGRPERGLDSHFYAAAPAECQSVMERFGNDWIYESSNLAFNRTRRVRGGNLARVSAARRLTSNR